MANFSATVEQAGDGSWTAAVIGKHTFLGTGDTKDSARENLREGMDGRIGPGFFERYVEVSRE
jgi:predicted RNase H-like HicB family nuclease